MPVLDVPYHSQLDNAIDPYGTCNTTSVAMVLSFYGVVGDGDGQLEDQLTKECAAYGWDRHNPLDLRLLLEAHGRKDNFTPKGTIQDVHQSIDNGHPCILHGYFTRSGHIITVIGYDNTGLIVHDPYGEWNAWGYNRNTGQNPYRGKGLHYSYSGIIQPLCSPESNPCKDLYLHQIQ